MLKDNLIILGKTKKVIKKKTEKRKFKKHLGILSFNELITESNDFMNEIDSHSNDILFNKGEMFMNEFQKRVNTESKSLSEKIRKFKTKLGEKIQAFGDSV